MQSEQDRKYLPTKVVTVIVGLVTLIVIGYLLKRWKSRNEQSSQDTIEPARPIPKPTPNVDNNNNSRPTIIVDDYVVEPIQPTQPTLPTPAPLPSVLPIPILPVIPTLEPECRRSTQCPAGSVCRNGSCVVLQPISLQIREGDEYLSECLEDEEFEVVGRVIMKPVDVFARCARSGNNDEPLIIAGGTGGNNTINNNNGRLGSSVGGGFVSGGISNRILQQELKIEESQNVGGIVDITNTLSSIREASPQHIFHVVGRVPDGVSDPCYGQTKEIVGQIRCVRGKNNHSRHF